MLKQITFGLAVLFSAALAPAESQLVTLQPFIDNKVVIAGQADPSKIDLEVVEKWVVGTMKTAEVLPTADIPDAENDIHTEWRIPEKWLKDFQAAGGGPLCLLINGSDQNMNQGFLFVAPTKAGANEKSIMSLFLNGTPNGPTTRPKPTGQMAQYEQYMPHPEWIEGKAVMMGTPKALKWAKAVEAKDRPEFATALATNPDKPAYLLLAPTDEFRRILARELPPKILLQSTTPLTQGILWAAAGATPPPNPTVHAVVQAKDAATAKAILQLIGSGLALAKAANEAAGATNADDIVAVLTPTQNNDQLVLDLDQDKLVKLARQLGPVVRKGRAQAKAYKSMNNMRQILMACTMYSNDHKGDWPDKLDGTKKYLGPGFDQTMTNPNHPELKPAFVYVKPHDPRHNTSRTMVLYESHTKFEGINVGFADGHCERIMDKKTFDDLLQTSGESGGDKDGGL